MMHPQQILASAAKTLADPQRVCVGALARNGTGGELCPTSRKAARWCAIGALYAAARRAPGDKKMPRELIWTVAAAQLASAVLFKASLEVVLETRGAAAALDAYRLAWRWAAEYRGIDQ